MVQRYGGASWFQLGDADLATHLLRTEWLRGGQSLTEVTARLACGLGIAARLLPASDEDLDGIAGSVQDAEGRRGNEPQRHERPRKLGEEKTQAHVPALSIQP
jgi:2-phospho-L-lactate transferase/gluconeogenesis factor (CofD/UPF0052 family)